MLSTTVVLSCLILGIHGTKPIHPLFNAFDLVTPVQYAEQFGYPGEEHNVTTEDGYILTIHRIPHGLNGTEPNKKPVFIMHGTGGNSACFADVSGNRSIAFILADAGYDVWLGNARGNSYGLNHKTLDPFTNPKEFYNFSWHEIGYYDLPASIDYILEVTGEKKLHYMGHSQGGTVFYVMTSTRPEYNDKIRLASLMAPSSIMKNVPSIWINLAAAFIYPIIEIVEALNIFYLPTELLRIPAKYACKDEPLKVICELIYFAGFDDWEQLDPEWFPSVFDNNPSPAATKQLYHYGQIIHNGGDFKMYDFGEERNQIIYNQTTPPEYNIKAISAPVAYYYSKNDMFISTSDIDAISEKLSNVVRKYLVPWEKFGHLDHLYAKDVVSMEYQEIIDFMKDY